MEICVSAHAWQTGGWGHCGADGGDASIGRTTQILRESRRAWREVSLQKVTANAIEAGRISFVVVSNVEALALAEIV